MRGLIFTSRHCAAAYAAAKKLSEALMPAPLSICRVVDRASCNREELLLIAQHGVVEPVVFLLEDDSGVRVRLTTLPTVTQVKATLMRIGQSPTPNA